MTMSIFPTIEQTLYEAQKLEVGIERQAVLEPLIIYVLNKLNNHESINLNFICTHNSRRSQFAQIWAKTIASKFNLKVNSMSGGVEVTDFNLRAIHALRSQGFDIPIIGGNNPKYSISFSSTLDPIEAYSKLFDHDQSVHEPFVAVMTCSHADENCPFIPSAEQRVPLYYDDLKDFDNTPREKEMYQASSILIASELFHAFKTVSEQRK